MSEDWEFMIVLDACRYDYFEKLYHKYFSGKLEKRISPGYDTISWFKKTFTGYYPDIIYVSSNPFIGSSAKYSGFYAGKHFYRVIDVWWFGWDDKLGTVHPRETTYVALNMLRINKNKRMIVHYIQPHEPYISEPFKQTTLKFRELINHPKSYPFRVMTQVFHKFYKPLKLLIMRALDEQPNLRKNIRRKLLGIIYEHEYFAENFSIDYLRRAYEANLDLVLKYAAILCHVILGKNPHAKIVITSDHGELLGEDNLLGHNYNHPLTRLIPLFRVKKATIPDEILREFFLEELKARLSKVKVKLMRR
ncbi:MAG: hypothetical protein ACTSX9_09725 [Candidatus Njordarchaeales archaeon]